MFTVWCNAMTYISGEENKHLP